MDNSALREAANRLTLLEYKSAVQLADVCSLVNSKRALRPPDAVYLIARTVDGDAEQCGFWYPMEARGVGGCYLRCPQPQARGDRVTQTLRRLSSSKPLWLFLIVTALYLTHGVSAVGLVAAPRAKKPPPRGGASTG